MSSVEGEQQTVDKDAIIAELIESNKNYAKHIKLLEKEVAEMENKVLAPIRNDAAFLLKLSEIRKAEYDVNFYKSLKDHPTIYISTNILIYFGSTYSYMVHPDFFKKTFSLSDFGNYLHYRPFYLGGSSRQLNETLSSQIAKMRSNIFLHRNENTAGQGITIIRKAFLTVGYTRDESILSLFLELHEQHYSDPKLTHRYAIVELDDLSDKDLIEKLYKKENLIE